VSPNSFNAKRLRSKTKSRLSRASPYPHWIVFVRLSATERYPVKPAPSRQFTSSLSCHGAAAGKIAMGNPSSRPSPEREKVWPSAISRCARAHSATSARRFRCHSGRFTPAIGEIVLRGLCLRATEPAKRSSAKQKRSAVIPSPRGEGQDEGFQNPKKSVGPNGSGTSTSAEP
jgi:hypothetical protein